MLLYFVLIEFTLIFLLAWLVAALMGRVYALEVKEIRRENREKKKSGLPNGRAGERLE